ncbi:uncharacterized protein ACN427_003629 isoform 1-T3 [Glossina fuscipes fuscipes]|uniref:Lebercilin domain-containing protein n=1 Tax=Glossina palpalis gambiensis TaxID=67801 RepID=A0A1B0B455_9MUSC
MVSPRKASSCLSLVQEEEKSNPVNVKSCESVHSHCSSKSMANIIYRAKRPVGRGPAVRQPSVVPVNNEIRQRVLSARRLRMKTFQNQLADAQQTIAELAHENRMLRTLHKRQDSALAKYESTNAELPQLLHSHAEELRVWQTKHRNLQATNKELEQKLKQKESLILSLSDQNKYYIQLNKDKNLEDRQRLTEKLQALETRLQEKENDIKMMARKFQLEAKQFKQHLQMEQRKTKEVMMKLEKSRLELSGFRKLEELQLQERFNMQMRRNKAGGNEEHKDDKISEKSPYTDGDTAEDTEVPTTHRSSHSTNVQTQRTTRAVKKMNSTTKNLIVTPTVPEPQKETTAPTKPVAVLRRINQTERDTSEETYKVPKTSLKSSTLQQQQPLSALSPPKPEKLQPDYEDEYENADDEARYSTEDTADETLGQLDEETDENGGGFMANIDGDADENDQTYENEEFYNESGKVEFITPTTGKKSRMKEEISTIRKQISNDYKEREAFLDTFCRQATSGIMQDDNPKIFNAADHKIPVNRKHKLLAALKAIDTNKSQD